MPKLCMKMTGGGLRKKDLKYNKHGKIVSKKMSQRAKKEKRLQKAGYTTVKGQFGAVNMDGGKIKCHQLDYSKNCPSRCMPSIKCNRYVKKSSYEKKKERLGKCSKIKKIIDKLQWNYLIFNSLGYNNNNNNNNNNYKINIKSLDKHEKLVYDIIFNWLINAEKESVIDYSNIKLFDGAKKTLVCDHYNKVLKIYSNIHPELYYKEKENYNTVYEIKESKFFEKVYEWNDSSFTSICEKILKIDNKQESINIGKKINDELAKKGYIVSDLNRGDNIGYNIKGEAVIFDIKSLRKI